MGHRVRLVVVLLRACGRVKRSRLEGGPRVCVGPRGLMSRIGAGARELRVLGADVGAPSDASVPDRMSGR
jgi:hypothetical protein